MLATPDYLFGKRQFFEFVPQEKGKSRPSLLINLVPGLAAGALSYR
jgi:hypothetical protein